MTIQTNGNGTVTIKVYDDDTNTLITQGIDSGWNESELDSRLHHAGHYTTAQYPPLTGAGSIGVRDFDNFNLDNFSLELHTFLSLCNATAAIPL